MKKFLAILLAGVLMVAVFGVCASANDNLCNMNDQDAVAAAQQKREDMKAQWNVWDVSRRVMWQLKANQTTKEVKEMEALLTEWKAILEDNDTLYTADYYGSFDGALEGKFKTYAAKYGVHANYAKGGWYSGYINVSDSPFASARVGDENYEPVNDNSDLTAEQKAALKALGQFYVDSVLTNNEAWAALDFAKWMAQTSDIEARTLEQIYCDMLGEGIQADNTNSNEDAIENDPRYTDKDAVNASLHQIAAKYQEMATKAPAIKPLADAYSAYVAVVASAAPSNPTTPTTPSNPDTADVAIIALAVSSVASLAGAFIAKKSK